MTQERLSYISQCPACLSTEGLVPTTLRLAEGPLRQCRHCQQLVSSCTEVEYADSMREFENPRGTTPASRAASRFEKRARRTLRQLSEAANATSLSRGPRLDPIGEAAGQPLDRLSLLDVGCSSGAFLSAAKKYGFRVQGVEPSPGPATTARQQGLDIFQGYLQDACFSDATFDVLTLFEVIEHLRAPKELLTEAYRILKPKGVMLIGTGNAASYTVAAVGDRWDYFDMRQHGGHVSFFNPDSLCWLAESVGFHCEHIQTRNVRLVERGTRSALVYRLVKLSAQLIHPLARLMGRGHDMTVLLRKLP